MGKTLFLMAGPFVFVLSTCSETASEEVDAGSHVMNDATQNDANSDAVSPDGAPPDGAPMDGGLPDGSTSDGGAPSIADLCWEACTYVDICGGGPGTPDPACLTGPGSCGEDLLDCTASQLLDVEACNDDFAVNADCMAFGDCLSMIACIG